MELLNKWLKSPQLISVVVVLILLPCAWYTYSLFFDMTEEEVSSSFVYNSEIKHLNLVLRLQAIQHEVSQVKAHLESLSGYDERKVKSQLSDLESQKGVSLHLLNTNLSHFSLPIAINGQEADVRFNHVISDHSNSALQAGYQKIESVKTQLFINESTDNLSLLAVKVPLTRFQNEGASLVAVIDLNKLFTLQGLLNGQGDGLCLSLFTSPLLTSSITLFEPRQDSCQLNSSKVKQSQYQITWFNQDLTFFVAHSGQTQHHQTLSLSNVLALLLTLMSSLIVFYIYRSRRYENKIEVLLKERVQSLKEVRIEYSKLFMLSVDGIYRASLTGNLLKANPAYASAFGYQDEDELCTRVNDIGEQLHQNASQYGRFLEQLKHEKRVIGFEWQSHDMTGRPIWLLENAYLTRHENGEVYYEGFIADITQKKKAELALKNQAQMDSLTGLLNRATFVNQVSRFIEQNSIRNSAIFFIDLDKFKTVNDQYGHHVGDELLIEFSKRLKACFSNEEMISRLGGDEFSVFLKEIQNLPRLHELADKVVAGLRKPFAFSNGCNFKISASIGISLLDDSVKNASEGLKQADMAMYEAKRNGRADFIIFNQGLNETERRRSLLEKSLFTALKYGEINVNYQPIVCFDTGEIKGMEALMRWHNEVLGNVSPVEFIPIAEQINLINSFSNWLIHQVCHDLKGLINSSGNDNLFVSINISPKQLLSDQVCDNLLISLDLNKLLPKNIKLEITETAIYDQEESVVRQLRRIRSYGIGIYIDDFGTGYSSLERLIQYPFDGLKIDRSFVKNLVPGNSQDVILKTSVKMAEMLNLVVVVEGIESHFQYDFFKDLACEYAQGFLLFKPLPVAELSKLLAREYKGEPQKMIDETSS